MKIVVRQTCRGTPWAACLRPANPPFLFGRRRRHQHEGGGGPDAPNGWVCVGIGGSAISVAARQIDPLGKARPGQGGPGSIGRAQTRTVGCANAGIPGLAADGRPQVEALGGGQPLPLVRGTLGSRILGPQREPDGKASHQGADGNLGAADGTASRVENATSNHNPWPSDIFVDPVLL